MITHHPPFQPEAENHWQDEIYQTPLSGMYFIQSERYGDERGQFAELFKLPMLNQVLDLPFEPAQVNHTHSSRHTIRGLHAEDWNKLVSVVAGNCYCVLVDVRPTSPTFAHLVSIALGTEPGLLYGGLYIPRGVANSVLTLSESSEYLYLVDKLYQDRDPQGDVALSLFDSELAIEWPIARTEMKISERDASAISWREKFPL